MGFWEWSQDHRGQRVSYRIVRFYRDIDEQPIIESGLTLEEASRHCDDPETSSSTATSDWALRHTVEFGPWFEGMQVEG